MDNNIFFNLLYAPNILTSLKEVINNFQSDCGQVECCEIISGGLKWVGALGQNHELTKTSDYNKTPNYVVLAYIELTSSYRKLDKLVIEYINTTTTTNTTHLDLIEFINSKDRSLLPLFGASEFLETMVSRGLVQEYTEFQKGRCYTQIK